MKLGIVSDEQFQKELNNTNQKSGRNDTGKNQGVKIPAQNQGVKIPELVPNVESHNKGRPLGSVEVPESVRKLIAEESALNGRQAAIELARGFGISESSVSAYAVGSTSTATYHKPDSNLQSYLEVRKGRRAKQALRVLRNSLDELTPDKLNGIKGRDLAGIAKDMASVVKSMEPSVKEVGDSNAPRFIVYAPQIRSEQSFDFITVNESDT